MPNSWRISLKSSTVKPRISSPNTPAYGRNGKKHETAALKSYEEKPVLPRVASLFEGEERAEVVEEGKIKSGRIVFNTSKPELIYGELFTIRKHYTSPCDKKLTGKAL